ncbi:hypothetical protein DPMN_113537 [Dreissena polymorpha]|nr:hypothetical protein DPMN_113537 [Dreissena polymorpha]
MHLAPFFQTRLIYFVCEVFVYMRINFSDLTCEMPFCGPASTLSKVAMVLSFVILILHTSGYATNYWMIRYTAREDLDVGFGLWRMSNCSGYNTTTCAQSGLPANYLNTKVTAVRVMETVVLALIIACAICLALFVARRKSRTRGMVTAVMTIFVLAALVGVASKAVWVVQSPTHHYPGWSFGLTVFAITLNFTVAAILIPDVRQYDYKDLLEGGGYYDNIEVEQEDRKSMSAGGVTGAGIQAADYRDEARPVIETQGPKGAPVFQYLPYDKHRKMGGF